MTFVGTGMIIGVSGPATPIKSITPSLTRPMPWMRVPRRSLEATLPLLTSHIVGTLLRKRRSRFCRRWSASRRS